MTGPQGILAVVAELRAKVTTQEAAIRAASAVRDELYREVYKLRGRPGQPRKVTCGAVWTSHGCDLDEGHDGDHTCIWIEVDEDTDEDVRTICSTCPQGSEDEFVRPGPRRWCSYCREWRDVVPL